MLGMGKEVRREWMAFYNFEQGGCWSLAVLSPVASLNQPPLEKKQEAYEHHALGLIHFC